MHTSYFLPGVIFFQIERKKLAFYCIVYNNLRPLCNITQCMQCIILYTECNSHSMCNYTHTNVTQRIPSFYTQCVVLHTVCSLCNLLGPINHNLRYFVAKSVCRNSRVLRCKIFCPKFLPV